MLGLGIRLGLGSGQLDQRASQLLEIRRITTNASDAQTTLAVTSLPITHDTSFPTM
jgi:hypothetical protein